MTIDPHNILIDEDFKSKFFIKNYEIIVTPTEEYFEIELLKENKTDILCLYYDNSNFYTLFDILNFIKNNSRFEDIKNYLTGVL